MEEVQNSSPKSPTSFASYTLLSSAVSGPGNWSTFESEDTNSTRIILRLLPVTDVPIEMHSKFETHLKKLVYLNHPNVFRILKAGRTDSHFYIASEWTGSISFNERIAESNEIQPLQMLLIVRQVIQGLAAAHQSGIAHGNLSAARIFLDSHGRYKVDGFVGNSDIEYEIEDRKALVELLKHIMEQKARPEIHQRVAKLIQFIANPEFEKVSGGYRAILKQIAPIISLCDGAKISHEISLFCPFCRDPLTGTSVVRCSVCFTPHHKSCWKEARKCSIYNCTGSEIARIWSKKKIIGIAALVTMISLSAIAGWGFYFYEKTRTTPFIALPQNQKMKPVQPRTVHPRNIYTPKRPPETGQKKPPTTQQQIAIPSPPEESKPSPSSFPNRIILNIEQAEVLFPKPGDTLNIGSTYNIMWVNKVPQEYWDSPDLQWNLNIGTLHGGGYYRLYSTSGGASSFALSVTDEFLPSESYKLEIYLSYECKYGATCFGFRGNGYHMIQPFSVVKPDLEESSITEF